MEEDDGVFIQHATLMRRIVISGLSGPQYFPPLSHDLHDFGGKLC